MIFMYHGVLPEGTPEARWCIGQALPVRTVRLQVQWLARRFQIVPITEYLAAPFRRQTRQAAVITLDDGAKETFDAIKPELRREGVPATIFVSTGHLCGGPLLWFSYLNALCFEDVYAELAVKGRRFRLVSLEEKKLARRDLEAMAKTSPSAFVAELEATYPLPPETLHAYGGMTAEQLASAGRDDLLEIGSHTVTHPYLTGIPAAEQIRELAESKTTLAALTGRPIRYFAYPSGDYDGAVLARVREAGYEAAFATRPHNVGDERFEIARVGIYSASMFKLRLKAAGVVELARLVGWNVG